MKVVEVETLRPAGQPNVAFIRLHTDDGAVGLGESFYGAKVVEAYVHETAAPVLLALDDPTPEKAAEVLRPYIGYQGGGAEMRGNGAIDMALWDLLGKAADLPLVDLMGGAVRDRIPVYNTCAGTRYVSSSTLQTSANWGVDAAPDGPWEDLAAFLTRPGELAADLWSEGLTGMKIWPFDRAAEAGGGTDISPRDLAEGLRLVAQVREAVGEDMKLLIELHGLWSPRGARAICRGLEEFRPFWVEDPVRPDATDALARLADSVETPIATGETCTGRRGFLHLLEAGALDVATVDIGWTGGLTEARKIATLADCYGVPVAPHDCTGPISLAVAVHLVCSQPNGLIQETARAFLRTWYSDLAEGVPDVVSGTIRPQRRPGHGVTLVPDITDRPDVAVRRSRA